MTTDIFNVQRGIVGKGAGDDTYILSPELIDAGAQITITDAAGANTIQLIGGLEIASSQTAATAIQLTLSNGAVVTVLGADSYTFALGGNPLTGEAPNATTDFAGMVDLLTATPAFTVNGAPAVDITTDNADAVLAAVQAVDATASTVQEVADNAAAAVDITTDNADAVLAAVQAVDATASTVQEVADNAAAAVDITTDNADAVLAAVQAVDATASTVAEVATNAAAAVDITTDNADAILAAVQAVDATASTVAEVATNAAAAVDITTDNADAVSAAVAADTAFASLADLVAAYDALANPAGGSFGLTTDTDVRIGVGAADAFTGSDTTLTSGDVIVDGTVGDGDTLTLTGAAFATAINSTGTAIANIENIVVNFDSLTPSTFNAAGVVGVVDVTVNQVRAGSSAQITVSNLDSDAVVNAGTGLTGGMVVAPGAANANAVVNTGTATGTFDVDTTGTGTIITTGGDATLDLDSANGNITVTKTGTAGAVNANSTGSGNVVITADATTAAVTGISATGNVTVDADASTTVTATATAGTAIVDAAAATSITATGSSVTVTSANVGTTGSSTTIAVNGTAAGTADSATVTANGVVTLTNNANLEAITLSGNSAAATYTIAASEVFTVTGDQNVTIAGTEANISASRVTDSATGTLAITVTDAGAGTGVDYSRVASDSITHSIAAGVTAGTYTYADAASVTLSANPAGAITVDIDDDAAATNISGSLNLTLGAATTAVITVNNTADEIDTLNISSNVNQGALDIRADATATTGDTINLAGSANYTVSTNTTALAVNASSGTGILTATAGFGGGGITSVTGGSAADVLTIVETANASVDGGDGNDSITYTGVGALLATNTIEGGDGTDTLTIGAGGAADISAATVSGIEIIAQGANAVRVNADQVNLQGLVVTGSGAVTVDNIGASLSMEAVVFSDATATTVIDVANTDPALGAGAARVITGTNIADAITGGNGGDTLIGGAGNDNLTGGAGADALIGGLGNNTYTYTAAGQAAVGETITFNTTTGATETIAVNTASVDLSEINGGALLTGLDAITIASGLTATMDASQVTGLTLSATGVAAGATETLALNGTAGDDTIVLTNLTLTNASVTVAAGAGNDAITANAGGGTFTGGAGADTITGAAGSDIISYADVTASSSHSLANLTGMAVNLSAAAVTSATVTTAMGGTVVLGGGDGVAGADLAAGTAAYLTTNGGTSTTTMVRDTFTGVEGVTGSALNDYIVGSANADTITGGAGADSLAGGAGADTFVLVEGDSVAYSAAVFAGANVAANDTITFGNGVDVITDFTAGAGGDILSGVDAAAVPTTGIGVATANGFTADTFFLSGSYNTGTGVFTVTADGVGADTMILDVENHGAIPLSAVDDIVILVGVDSDDLVAGNFVA